MSHIGPEFVRVHCQCTRCGYDLMGQSRSDGIRCPECGAPYVRKSAQGWSRGWAIFTIILVSGVLLLLILPAFTTTCRCRGSRPLREQMEISRLAEMMTYYAQDTQASLPHPATLILENYVDFELFTDELALDEQHQFTVLGQDMVLFEWSEESVALLESSIDAAIVDGVEHRVGDRWFANWPSTHRLGFELTDPAAMIVWSLPRPDTASRDVAFADGHLETITARDWPRARTAHFKLLALPWRDQSAIAAASAAPGPRR